MVGFGDGIVEVRNAETWDVLATLRGHRDIVWSFRFLQQEQTLLTASGDSVIRFWDMETYRELGVLFGDFQEAITIEERDALATIGGEGPLKIFSATPGMPRSKSSP